ncbi:MAG: hypothetical protein JW973_17620 [Bacteroidales bacterium]|nr:hypothetical protein [Bacteroidales bacterium]
MQSIVPMLVNNFYVVKYLAKYVLSGLAILFFICTCEKENNPFGGTINKLTDCKYTKSTVMWTEIMDTMSCIQYSYDPENQSLLLQHINAGFNCCPGRTYFHCHYAGDTLIIYENETSAACDCNCLFDLEYQISDIALKKYHVILMEPYAEDKEKIQFEMDLISSNSGSKCVIRKGYPWGQ